MESRRYGMKGMYEDDNEGYDLPGRYDYYQNQNDYQQNYQQKDYQSKNYQQQNYQQQNYQLSQNQQNQQNYQNSYGYQEYPNYQMDNNGYYGYGSYDNNAYITDGNEYLSDDFNYIENEYSYDDRAMYQDIYYGNNNGQYNNYYNQNEYGLVPQEQQYNDNMLYNISSGIKNDMDDALTYGNIYAKNNQFDNSMYANSEYYLGNYDYGNSREKFNERHKKESAKDKEELKDLEFDDVGEEVFSVDSRYFEDSEDDDKIFSWSDLLNLGICIVMALALAYLITFYVAQHTEVDGHSMNFNLKNQDILIIDKLSYRFDEPQRFDIIVFPIEDGSTYYIKRIIGLPGETVRVTSKKTVETDTEKPSTIYINGEALEENYGFEESLSWGTEQDVVLGEDEYFVMGDNRNDSRDSRDRTVVGSIKKSDIVGKAVFRLYPFDTFGLIDNTINKRIKIDKEYSLGVDGDEVVSQNEDSE